MATAVQYIESIFVLAEALGLSSRLIAYRVSIRNHVVHGKEVKFLVINTIGLLHDGLHLSCLHPGLADKVNGTVVYHGTMDLPGIIHSNGVLRESRRNIKHCRPGWYNGALRTAVKYAGRHHFKTYAGRHHFTPDVSSKWRPILKIKSRCINTVRKRDWTYTRVDCLCYRIEEIMLAFHTGLDHVGYCL